MARTYVLRAGQKIGLQRTSPLVPGDADAGDILHELYALRGIAAQLLPITPTVGVSAVADYPSDGDSIVDAAAATSITLDAAGAPAFDLTGFLVVLLTGAANVAGQVRTITNYNTTTKVATVDTWTVTPAAGDTYAILYDTEGRSSIFLKPEFESSTGSCTVLPIYFDYPRNPSKGAAGGNNGQLGVDGTVRRPRRYYGVPMNLGVITSPTIQGTGTEQASYFHGSILAQDCRGASGCKVRLHVAPLGAMKVALWLAAT